MALRDDLKTWIAKKIWQAIDTEKGDVVTSARWDELFNLLIQQGDDTSKTLKDTLNMLYETILDDTEGAKHLLIQHSEFEDVTVHDVLLELARRIELISYNTDMSPAEKDLAYFANNAQVVLDQSDYMWNKTLQLLYATHLYSHISVSGNSSLDDILNIEVKVNDHIYQTARKRLFAGDNTIDFSLTLPAIPSGYPFVEVRMWTDSGTYTCDAQDIQISITGYGVVNSLVTNPNFDLEDTFIVGDMFYLDTASTGMQTPISSNIIEELETSIVDVVTIELT